MSRIWVAVLAAGLLAQLAAAAKAPDSGIEFESAWVRALPPFQPTTAGYLTFVNRGEIAVAIVGASANIADKVELHTTRMVDGLMRMEELQGLAVAPGERVQFAPGGTHLMLLGLTYMPAPGDDVRLCLRLASGAEACTAAEVRSSGTGPGAQKPEHHHPTEE